VAAHLGHSLIDEVPDLTLYRAGNLSVVWSAFDHVAASARLVVVGITPGRHQAEVALEAFRSALRAGMNVSEASRRAKLTAAFSGPMRDNLVAMLDFIGVHRALGVSSAAQVFDPGRELMHLTSAVRYPTFVAGANYNGSPDLLRTPVLREIVDSCLAAEARALPKALWLPLGPKPAAALSHLVSGGLLSRHQVLEGLPHPSGANGERIAYFLQRKSRDALSAKTNARQIDDARSSLCERVSRFALRA
jgi:hypothetical protein